MKKLTMFLMAMAVGFAATAQTTYLVYNYKASIQTVKPYYQKVSYDFNEYDAPKSDHDIFAYFDTFDIAKDSLKGYLVYEDCKDCAQGGVAMVGSADLFVQRKGDKDYNDVYKIRMNLDAAMFGRGAASRIPDDSATPFFDEDPFGWATYPSGLNALKKGWMEMNNQNSISANYNGVVVELKDLASPQTTFYGFLGLQNSSVSFLNSGYGKVKVVNNKTRRDIAFCGMPIVPGSTCIFVVSMKGCFVGQGVWDGLCSDTPMWDICDETLTKSTAPICGKWSIKLNKKLTDVYSQNPVDQTMLDQFKSYGQLITR